MHILAVVDQTDPCLEDQSDEAQRISPSTESPNGLKSAPLERLKSAGDVIFGDPNLVMSTKGLYNPRITDPELKWMLSRGEAKERIFHCKRPLCCDVHSIP